MFSLLLMRGRVTQLLLAGVNNQNWQGQHQCLKAQLVSAWHKGNLKEQPHSWV